MPEAYRSPNLYTTLKKHSTLWDAWKVVQSNGQISKSASTRDEVQQFAKVADQGIRSISSKLSHHTFKFSPAKGVPIKRAGKRDRPIIRAPILNRIVQRAILDCLQATDSLKNLYSSRNSFGGLKNKGVREAWGTALSAIDAGYTHYIRSDIHDFFSHIPREEVISRIVSILGSSQDEFVEILSRAMDIELENMVELGKKADLFPIHDVGVAQGCCLSPLFGNVLLGDFDSSMNDESSICIRYIDDFLILTKGHRKAKKAMDKALSILASFKLTAYDPAKNPEKAASGLISNGVDFLGCEFHPGLLTPNRKTRQKLISSVSEIFSESESYMDRPALSSKLRKGLLDAFIHADHVLEGWGNQYSFCNNLEVMKQLDAQIDSAIRYYLQKYQLAVLEAGRDPNSRRRLLGMHLLVDSKRDPLIKR